MKKNLLPLLLLAVGMFTNAACAQELFIGLNRMPVAQALDMYQLRTGRILIVSKHVHAVTNKITIMEREVESEEAMLRLIERALLEQAAVIITELGNKRYSATFNDALPAGGLTNILNYTPPPLLRRIESPPSGVPGPPRFPLLPSPRKAPSP